jgi:hypothetical protein
MKKIIMPMYILTMSLIFYISTGYVLSKVWGWLVVETLGLQPISITTGILMHLTFCALKGPSDMDEELDDEQLVDKGIKMALYPWIVLLVSYIVTLFQ